MGILERPPPSFDRRIKYGSNPQNFADLRFPSGRKPYPLLLMIHGGFWQSIYDLSHTGHLCQALTAGKIVTCNVEYRRLGDPGGGWPGTFQDISLAARHIPEILSSDPRVDTTRVAVMGHSAGGHLALWLVGSHKVAEDSPLHQDSRNPITSAISLAGVTDLRMAWKQRLGNGIVLKLMGGTPDEFPDRYRAGSPIELLPSSSTQVLIHGTADNIVPISQSEDFVDRAQELGEEPTLVKLESTGHFELIDPETDEWSTVASAVLRVLKPV